MLNQNLTPVVFPCKKIFKKQSYGSIEYFDESQNFIVYDFTDLEDFLDDNLTYIRELSDMASEAGNHINPAFLNLILNTMEKDLKTFFHFLNQQAVIRIDAIKDDGIVGVRVHIKHGLTQNDAQMLKNVLKMKGFWEQISLIVNLFGIRIKSEEGTKIFDDTVDRMSESLKAKYRE